MQKSSLQRIRAAVIYLIAADFLRTAATITSTEEIFLSVPSADSAKEHLRFITSEPHVAGTKGDFKMANFVAKQFQDAGIANVSIFNLDVLLNFPESAPRVLLLSSSNGTVLYEASMSENVEAFDDTSDSEWRNNTFHGYSPSGDVTGPLVYANYGRPQDFAALLAAGVNVSGAIVIVRYGQCFRGLKVWNAQERGALGIIIYSDPADDGYVQGPVYPAGPWRPASGVQRGSVQIISKCAGDPMRADSRYESNAVQKRCDVDDYTDLIPRIPSVPMSYGDAMPLLQQLGGPTAIAVGGEGFVGGLNITYAVGPSTNTIVRLVVDNAETTGTIPNVVGYIPGSLGPTLDMPVLLGNHRDAWYVVHQYLCRFMPVVGPICNTLTLFMAGSTALPIPTAVLRLSSKLLKG
jgi:N-acetylated-alpha-linked acidic dipeptidase